MVVCCLAYSSALKMDAKCSSETSVDVRRAARRYIPEYTALPNHYVEDCRAVTVRRFEGTDIFR
jgi:hypothetical protein